MVDPILTIAHYEYLSCCPVLTSFMIPLIIPFFLRLFFHNFITDILFLTPQKLWSFVLDDDLDHMFGLGGAAIAAALRDFRDGFYVELGSSTVQWCEDYTRTMRIITGMHEQPAHKEWLVTCQQNLMARGRAGLPPTTTVD